uniref:Uncharacterized protein n=2 Tax=Caenorhabditis japonica TaxID=281687 RepID=A0A8R1DRH9_CAEJA
MSAKLRAGAFGAVTLLAEWIREMILDIFKAQFVSCLAPRYSCTMRSTLLAILLLLTVSTILSSPYQSYRTYRSPLRDGTFDHASMFRFTDGGSSANLPRDYPYAQVQYGASSPMYVFDGRLYNLASSRS